MKRLLALFALAGSLFSTQAAAQSGCSYIAYGAVLTAAQWNQCFQNKLDYSGSPPITSIIPLSPITATAGASTVTIGLNVGVNFNFTAAQTININGVTIQSPQTGTVLQLANANGTNTRLELDTYAATGHFSGVRADGTAAAPTALQSNDSIVSFNAFGYNGSAFVGPQAAFRCYAAQNWTTGPAYGTYCDIAITANGGSTLTESVRFENDGGITVPSTVTGGDKGAGTINAAGLYVNGSAVSIACITTSNALQYNASGSFGCVSGATSNGTALTVAQGDFVLGSNSSGTIILTTANAGSSSYTATIPANTGTFAETNLAETFSANQTFSAQLIATGTSAPSSAAGNTVVMGTIAAPSLSNNGQAFIYNTTVNGAVIQGQGSTYDVVLEDKAGAVALGVTTGTVNLVFGGTVTAASLSTPSSNIAGSLCATSSGVFLYFASNNCFAASATSVTVGTTTVTGGTTNQILYDNGGTLGEITKGNNCVYLTSGSGVPSCAAAGTGTTISSSSLSVTNPVTATAPSICDIVSTSATTCNNGGSAANNGTYTVPSGAIWLELRLIGGGSGGGGGNNSSGSTAGGATCWNTTGAACTSPVYQAGGGAASNATAGGAGGTISGSGTCGFSIAGGAGPSGTASTSSVLSSAGGSGANSTLGGAGVSSGFGGVGNNAASNSGSGGAGGGTSTAITAVSGFGGAAGATCLVVLSSLASTYTYAIGAGGAGASGGTDGAAGGNGGGGHLTVVAHFNY